ncbi:YdcF family protein [Amycolatopsis sp. K13G38]|uniref:YdcF family protein n=1 Tax=Amycolatopsis acididurans TaxID=2724524 RepID=A0ABX1JBU5_9PSEU|nr:YdcF family protein [Amycolatopsis acididurans]NKQ55840.1 YdcF family protein [Amycolatopsis acididurans]
MHRIPEELRADVETLWQYHDLGHRLTKADVGIGLGSHDLGVATHAAELFHAGLFPLIVFTGANAPTTVDLFPRGEAVHFREQALSLGVPDDAILIETEAANTGENFAFTKRLLADRPLRSAVLVCRPYQQRRAYATCRKVWPEIEVTCASSRLTLDDYVASIGDVERIITMLVGDTQRITVYAERGFAISQEMPDTVRDAFRRLVEAGYTRRLI